MQTATPVCLCGVCREMIMSADKQADHFVYSLGELDYIELAHAACGEADNLKRGIAYWQHD